MNDTITTNHIDATYHIEVAGDYPTARATFADLNNAITEFDANNRGHVLTRLYHADMLTMDGYLAEASNILLDAYTAVGELADRIELIRHRGHAHRFSFDYATALNEYTAALSTVGISQSVLAELATNLAETNCWIDPARGIIDATAAIHLNDALGNRIERGKAYAALAVAQSALGMFNEARASVETSVRYAETAGYPAGQCFALQARVVVELRAGNEAGAVRAYGQLVRAVEKLTTYGHLCIIPAYLLGDAVEIDRWSDGVELAGQGELSDRLEELFG